MRDSTATTTLSKRNRPHLRIPLLLLTGVLICLSCFVYLSRAGLVTVFWQHMPLSDIRHEVGFAYQAPTHHIELSSHKQPSHASVLENGITLLGSANAQHDDIRKIGKGRFSFWYDHVFFSASDNSNPLTNGRRYEIYYPFVAGTVFAWIIFTMTLVCCCITGVLFSAFKRCLSVLTHAVASWPFYTSAIIFVTLFVIGRLWVFMDFPVPGFFPDSGSYYLISEEIRSGNWPKLGDRAPLVPLMMGLVYSISDRVWSLIIFQNILSLASGLCLIYAVSRLRRNLSLWAALAVAAFYYSLSSLEYDTSLLSESLYTSCLILSFSFFLLCFSGKGNPVFIMLASIAMACVILTKSGGQYLFVVYVFIMGFLFWNKYSWKFLIGFGLPMPVLLFVLCLYNFYTIGTFNVTVAHATEITFVTNLYWETDAKYPQKVNAAVEKIQESTKKRLSIEELETLYTSWNIERLYRLYLKGHYYLPHEEIAKVTDRWGSGPWRHWLLTLSKDTIVKHPVLFLKHFVVMLIAYYKGIDQDYDFRTFLQLRALNLYVKTSYSKKGDDKFLIRLAKEYSDAPLPKTITVNDYDLDSTLDLNKRIVLAETPAWRLYYKMHLIRKMIFANVLWSIAFFAIFAASTIKLLYTKCRHTGAFILFILTVSTIGNAAVVSLVEYSQPRYSYPMEWTYYLSVVLLPILFMKSDFISGSQKSQSL